MDAQNGALHFDASINKQPYIQGIIDMENRTILFGNNVIAGNAAIQKSYDRLANSIGNGRFSKALDGAESRVEEFVNNIVANNATAAGSFTQFANVSSAAVGRVQAVFNNLAKSTGRGVTIAGNNITGFVQQTQASGDQLNSTFTNLGAAIAGYFTLSTLKNFGSQIITVTGQVQQLQVAYSTILGSKKQADALFAETIQLAKTTPFSLLEVAAGTKQLLAYGFSAKEVTGTLSKLGDVAAGVGQPLGDIAYLYGTLKTQGRAYAQDIRQFTGRGIPIIAELAKQFNTTEQNVNGLVEAGKIGFPEIEKVINKLTGSGGQFFNLMQAQSKTLTGQISNLGDNFDQLLAKIGNGNQGILNDGIAGLNYLIDHYQQVIDIIKELVIVYGSYKAAQAVLVAGEYAQIAALGLETIAYRLLTQGVEIFNAQAILAGATTAALTAAFAAFATILYAVTANTDAHSLSLKNLAQINADAAKDSQLQIDKITSLKKSIGDLNNTEDQRLQAVNKLREVMGDRLKQYTDEEILAGKASIAIKSYTDALLQNAKVAAAQDKLKSLNEELLSTDAKTQGVDQAYTNIPIRERLKGSLSSFLTTAYGRNGGSSNTKVQELNNYRQLIKDQVKSVLDIYGKGIDDANAGIDRTNKSKEIEQALAFQKLLKDVTGNFDKLIATSSGKKDFEAIGKALTDNLDLPNITDAQIAQIKADQAKLQPYIDKYSLKTDLKHDDTDNSFFEKRKSIYDKLGDLEQKRIADASTQDEKEIQQVKLKYKTILEEIDKYNRGVVEYNKKNPANKQSTINPNKLNVDANGNFTAGPVKGGKVTSVAAQQQSEIDDVTAKQQLVDFKDGLDKQKVIFDEYEKYKTEVGETEAQKRFGNELKGFKSYTDYLLAQADMLKNVANPGAFVNGAKDIVTKAIPKSQTDDAKRDAQYYSKLLVESQTYEDKRASLKEVAEAKILILTKAGKTAEAEVVKQSYQDDLNALDLTNVKKLAAYRELFENVGVVSDKTARKDLDTLQTFIDTTLDKNSQAYKTIQKLILDTKKGLDNKVYDNLLLIADAFDQVGGAMGGVSDQLSGLLSNIGGAIKSVASIGKLANDLKEARKAGDTDASGKATAGLITAGLSGITSIISAIGSAAAERKKEEEAYYASVLKQQNDYNLSLNEEIRLKTALSANVFTKDYKGTIIDGTKALVDANEKYMKSLDALQAGQVKLGQRNVVDPKTLAATIGSGVAAGAAIGTLVPGIGTAIGAVVGGVVGLIGGLFAKKKKDVFGGLLTEYPELIQKATDGTETFNKALAQSLIDNNLVDDKTKALLENTMALADARAAALEQINGVISDLAGSLGDDLRNSLVDAFKAGTDAATAFGDSVSKIIENIVAQFLFQDIFGSQFDQLQADMKASFDVGGDQNFVDDIVKFYQTAGPLVDQYNAGLQAAQDEAKKYGLDVFTKTISPVDSSLTGSVQRTITEATGSALEGLFRSYYDLSKRTYDLTTENGVTLKQQLQFMDSTLAVQMEIRDYSSQTATNTSRLQNIETYLNSINNVMTTSTTNPGYGKGIGGI